MYLYRGWLALIVDLAVTKFKFLFNRAVARRGAWGCAGVLGKHYIYMAFTSKIGA